MSTVHPFRYQVIVKVPISPATPSLSSLRSMDDRAGEFLTSTTADCETCSKLGRYTSTISDCSCPKIAVSKVACISSRNQQPLLLSEGRLCGRASIALWLRQNDRLPQTPQWHRCQPLLGEYLCLPGDRPYTLLHRRLEKSAKEYHDQLMNKPLLWRAIQRSSGLVCC